jgi:hypothetical protein
MEGGRRGRGDGGLRRQEERVEGGEEKRGCERERDGSDARGSVRYIKGQSLALMASMRTRPLTHTHLGCSGRAKNYAACEMSNC